MLVKSASDVKHNLVSKVGSIQLPHDLKGRLLEQELAKATQEFVYWIELRGWTLAHVPGHKNPQWVTDGSGPMAYYAIDWLGERTGTKRSQTPMEHRGGGDHYPTRDEHRGTLPTKRETTLDETDGMVEYRCVGVFWAPEVITEMLGSIYERKERERQAKNPVIFGPGGQRLQHLAPRKGD